MGMADDIAKGVKAKVESKEASNEESAELSDEDLGQRVIDAINNGDAAAVVAAIRDCYE